MYPGAVYKSAASGNVATLMALAKLGADVNDADEEGRTPMFLAAQNDHVKAVKMLAELGADVNRADKVGRTPVLMAAENGHKEACRALAELGAAVNHDESHLASQSANGVLGVLDAAE